MDIHENIALRLRAIRKEKGLTLEELAEISGVSRSMLGEIERGGTNPTILVLWKIAEGLKKPITAFLEAESPPYSLVRAHELQPFNQDEGYRIFSIFPYNESSKCEVLHIELEPGAELANSGHRLELDEIIILENGQIELALEDEVFALNSGDAIRFQGSLAHRIRNTCDETVRLVNLLSYY